MALIVESSGRLVRQGRLGMATSGDESRSGACNVEAGEARMGGLRSGPGRRAEARQARLRKERSGTEREDGHGSGWAGQAGRDWHGIDASGED